AFEKHVVTVAAAAVGQGAGRAGSSEVSGAEEDASGIEEAQVRLQTTLENGGSGAINSAAVAERDGLHRRRGRNMERADDGGVLGILPICVARPERASRAAVGEGGICPKITGEGDDIGCGNSGEPVDSNGD